MASKKTNQILAAFLDNQKKATTDTKTAMWLDITVDPDYPFMEVGGSDRAQAQPCLSFVADAFRHCHYAHPLSNLKMGLHIYSSSNGSEYKEAAGLIWQADGWHMANILETPTGRMVMPGRKLNPVSRKPGDKWADDQAEADEARIAKHNWGFYTGHNFRVYVAHIRKLAVAIAASINEPDDEKALQMRNDAYERKIIYKEDVSPNRPAKKVAGNTDQPDWAKEPDDEPVVEKQPVEMSGLIFPFIDKTDKLNGSKVDLSKLPTKGVISISLFTILKSGKASYVGNNGDFVWDPTDKELVDNLANMAKKGRIGVQFSETYFKAVAQ